MILPPDIIALEDSTEHINIMVYGDPGVGKTVFAGSSNNPLILATEPGTLSASRQGSKGRVWPSTTWEGFKSGYEWLYDNVSEPDFPFDWVVVDTGTTLQEVILEDIVTKRTESDASKNPDKVELQEWGDMHNRFRKYVNKINDLPVNVLWTAHAMMTEDEEANEFRMPQFQGKGNQMAMWMASRMHAYGYMHNVTVNVKKADGSITPANRRRIQWTATETVRAKDRFDCLGPFTTVGNAKTTRPLSDLTKMIHESAAIDEKAPVKKAPAKKVAAKKAVSAVVK